MSEADAGALGIFGGTFDPPHIGHLRLAIEAREALDLAEVRFVPAGRPALREAPRCPAEHRLAMVERAVNGRRGFSVDAAEVRDAARTSDATYTIDTLERLRQEQGPRRPLVLLLGADAFLRLEAWRRWRELFALAHIAVATRPQHELRVGAGGEALGDEITRRLGTVANLAGAPAGRIVPFAITALEVSATAIRERLARGADVSHLVPDTVLDYIDSNQLYRTPHGH